MSEETSPTNEQATEDGSPVKAVVRRKGARQIIDSDDSEDEGVAMETSISEESPAVSVSILYWIFYLTSSCPGVTRKARSNWNYICLIN